MYTFKNINIRYLLLISLVSALGGLLFGYDWVVIGGAKIFYESYFGIEGSVLLRGWAMSCALIGCLTGSILSGIWSDRYGRKKMLILASILFIVSALGAGASDNFTLFIIYRILGGLGIGIASNVSPMYIAEVSPAQIRGKFVSFNQLTIVIGILAAQIVNWQIGKYFSQGTETLNPESIELAWRWMFWSGGIPAVLFFILSFVIPESPRWMSLNNREVSAYKVFSRIGGRSFAEESLKDIKSIGKEEKSSIKQLFKPNLRKVMIIGIVLAIFQQFCGINIIFNYAHEIFSAAGYEVSDILMNIVITGVTNLIFTVVAIYTVDRWGRRSLMLLGSAGLTIIYAIIGIFYFFNILGLPLLILVVMAIACYAMSLAPIVWVLLSEIFPNHIRGMAMAASTFFLWTASFLITYSFPILNNLLGSYGIFWLYGIVCMSGFIFIMKMVPETKGKTLEEIENELTYN